MLKDRKVLFIILAILIIARIIVVFIEDKKDKQEELAANSQTQSLPFESEDESLVKKNLAKPKSSFHEPIFVPTSTDECQQNKKHYLSLNSVKKNYKYSERFFNIHKKIGSDVYRLRFFYKETQENEIPTYLLYKEDQNEQEHIIEKTSYRKGPQYAQIEKAHGEIIYREEGLTIGQDQDFFLHYENGELKTLQGKNPLTNSSVPIECHF